MIRAFHLDVVAAYAARLALTLVSLLMSILPRRHKITMLTRQSRQPPSDFVLLRAAILSADPTVEVVVIAKMVPPGVIRKFGYVMHLLGEMYHVATSRVLIVDGYSITASATRHSHGLTIVQVWHALGALKKFGLSMVGQPGGRSPKIAKAMRMHAGYDIVIASAERCRAPFAEAFGVDVSKVVVAPLPRVDRLTDPAEKVKAQRAFARLYPELSGQKIALFAPTFRTNGTPPIADPVELTTALADAGFATITKLHPLAAVPTHPDLRTAPGMSTQELLLVADAFITDYSSAVFEAAVAGVASYLLAPDQDQHSVRRNFYARYPEDLGLPLALSVDELARLVRDGAATALDIQNLRSSYVDTVHADSAAAHLAQIVLAPITTRTDEFATGSDRR